MSRRWRSLFAADARVFTTDSTTLGKKERSGDTRLAPASRSIVAPFTVTARQLSTLYEWP